MEEDSGYNKVVSCHVEDAITFWAQDIHRHSDILKTSRSLAEICPLASPVFGNPDLTRIYGGCFSEDKCWYRCKVLKVISIEKCQVLYIDYGNSEVLNRSEIVEIPENLQFPSVAKKYRLWGLQISANQDLNHFDQARRFLHSLIFEKEIKTRIKATYQDGTIVAEAECGLLDVGEEMAKKGFAERCKSPVNSNSCDTKMDSSLCQPRNANSPAPVWSSRACSPLSNRAGVGFGDNPPLNGRNEKNGANHVPFIKEKMVTCDFRRVSNISLEKIKQDQKMIEENEKLKAEKEAFRVQNEDLLHQCEELESTVKKLTCDLEEKKRYKETLEVLENTLSTYIGATVRNLADKFEKLKEARQVSLNARFGEDLSEAIKVVTEGCLAAPLSLEKLEKIWIDYNSFQEEICACKCVDEVQSLIQRRNEVQQRLYSTVEEYIMEVDGLPLSERLETLQKLQDSLEVVYGQVYEVESSEGAFEKFAEWKNIKLEEFSCVRNATDASLQNLVTCFGRIIQFFDMSSGIFLKSEDVGDNIDEVLKNAELNISQELNIFLTELDEADKKIILNVYSEVMQKINQENNLLSTIYHKYRDSIEFKMQIVEWLETSPNVDVLLLIKKRVKKLKAQLRWKVAEKNNLEESDDDSEPKMAKIKEEITGLRNNVFEEIYKEQEEYEKLNHLVQKWFPELPLLHPEAGILQYMNSGGLLTVSLERDLLDAEPMRELSTKRPLVCSEVQGQKVLLKGYAVDMNTEAEVIERAAKYHRLWRELKEESGLMQLMFLFLCKSDPLAYLMVPYYAEASLGILQTTAPLTPEETLKVMKGVARGLHTLHKAGIIHGSLHKSNVFAVNREQGIVGDFDFTKSESQRASMNSVLLNGLNLISPEVRQGQPPSPASDMYAFGCLLYWLVIGKEEFKIKIDGTPEVDGHYMDDKVKSLLTKLLCFNNRMTSEEVLNDDCFLLHEVIPVSVESEPTEPGNGEATTENEVVLPAIKNYVTEPFSDNTEPNSDACV